MTSGIEDNTSSKLSNISPEEYELIRNKVYELTRINLGPDKKAFVVTRLGPGLRARSIHSFKQYCELLKTSNIEEAEVAFLIDLISTNHSYFFRENHHFEFIKNKLVPNWDGRKALKILSAGCSSGEEPYTLSIILHQLRKECPTLNWTIDCSDISKAILLQAMLGSFDHSRLRRTDPSILSEYFDIQKPIDGITSFRIKPALKEGIAFHAHNLLKTPYPYIYKFDIIFCRNVMIYFDEKTQTELIQNLSDALNPNGYLFVGSSESLSRLDHSLERIEPFIYQKTERKENEEKD